MHNVSIKKKLSEARPNLKIVSPLVYRICQGFSVVNVLIAALFIFSNTNVKHVPILIAASPFAFKVWAVWYLVLGLAMAYSLYKNNWKLTRQTMIVGLFTKVLWLISLIILVFQGYNVFATMILWVALAWVQAWSIVHFMPVINWDGKGGAGNDLR